MRLVKIRDISADLCLLVLLRVKHSQPRFCDCVAFLFKKVRCYGNLFSSDSVLGFLDVAVPMSKLLRSLQPQVTDSENENVWVLFLM